MEIYSVNAKEFNFHIDEDIQVKEVKIEERLFADETTKKSLAEIIFEPGQEVFFFSRSANIDFENALQRKKGFWNREYMSWAQISDKNPISVRGEGQEKFYYGIAKLSEETMIKSIDVVRYDRDSVMVITPKSDDSKSIVLNLLAKHLDRKWGKNPFVYAPDGRKLRTTHITAIDGIVIPLASACELSDSQVLSVDSTDYVDNFIYENGVFNKYLFGDGYLTISQPTASAQIGDIATPNPTNEARALSFVPTFYYYTKDHLGNVRSVVNERGDVLQYTHYYPNGNIIPALSTSSSFQPYKYNGKELDKMHGLDWYDYGARNYDAVLSRWDRIDPLAEKYYHISPYAYCAGNLVNLVDPDGNRILVHEFDPNNLVWNYYHYDMKLRAFVDSDGNKYKGDNAEFESIRNAIIEICTTNEGTRLISFLANNEQNVLVKVTDNLRNTEGQGNEEFNCFSSVFWNPQKESKFGGSSYITLTHELAHSEDRINGTIDESIWTSFIDINGEFRNIKQAEKYSTHIENLIRKEKGLPLRRSYGYPSGAPILNRKNQSLYFDANGNHLPKYKRIKGNRYTY